MFEIYRMQLRQILGGRMKWLAVTVLLLPVLLTLALVGAGGLEELKKEINRENREVSVIFGEMPEGVQRVPWKGEDIEFLEGDLVLTEDGVFYDGEKVSGRTILLINDGRYVVRNGRLWIDRGKPERGVALPDEENQPSRYPPSQHHRPPQPGALHHGHHHLHHLSLPDLSPGDLPVAGALLWHVGARS
ncbi:MAG: hypothetical protein V2A76_19150 [Planctomycetota bacterium]